MSETTHNALDVGIEAMRRHDWEEARRLLSEADAARQLDGEGLRQLGKANYWCADSAGCIDAFERSYAAFVAAGNRRGAAKVALMLQRACTNMKGDGAAARGWVQRAEHLLEGESECVELGFLWRSQGRLAFGAGKLEEGAELLRKAIDVGNRLGSPNLVAMSLSWLGVSLAIIGRGHEGFPFLDEACAAAVGGELGPWATGIVYCNSISSYREAGEFAMGSEWTQTAGRWCERESITGWPGVCRVHRAEFLRLRGSWTDAESEARRAGSEMERWLPLNAAEAYYEVGEIRLRMGDFEGADSAFRQAHGLGRDPQPGAAMVLARQGKMTAALHSLKTSIESHELGLLDDMRALVVAAGIAVELGLLDRAEGAAQQAEAMGAGQEGPGLRVLALQARGIVQLARSDPAAQKTLRQTLRLWQEIDAPYEAALVRLLLARALRQSGDEAGARREGEAALGVFERLGAGPDAALARHWLEAPAPAPDSTPAIAQRTLFFSDIVGSTQLVEAIGDQSWAELVAWLDASMRECFVSHGGEEVDHAGDGFFVAFPDSKSALDCAVSIQRDLADHRRKHGFAPRVRIGIHATSASHAGGRYQGRGVHEASRIAALAGPDEIVASRATVPPSFRVSEPREATVKGISKPLELVTIDWKS
ncbi:MAG TPA: adenylate/guanylate cyclase domain-containing protein [Candidatus Dormibacteraeota bacterium]|nr:adenylate/guanylate cyclase domain-containing protein [Candidatus Dormibacteraeota bacterium]